MNKEPNIYSFADECYVYYGDYKKDLQEKGKEIERLSKEVDMWNRKYNEQVDIINELEKWYKKQYEDTNKCLDYAREHHNLQDAEKYTRDHNMFAMCMEKLDKLKELKEGK